MAMLSEFFAYLGAENDLFVSAKETLDDAGIGGRSKLDKFFEGIDGAFELTLSGDALIFGREDRKKYL